MDPYVELIVGLDRADGPGIWIPNRRNGWDPADPELHTDLMTIRHRESLRVVRAHILRLSKRAIKRDAANGGIAVMHSWNLSALALELIEEEGAARGDVVRFFGRIGKEHRCWVDRGSGACGDRADQAPRGRHPRDGCRQAGADGRHSRAGDGRIEQGWRRGRTSESSSVRRSSRF